MPADLQPVASGVGHSERVQRQLSPDGLFWWDGQRWLPYKRITWNSIQLRTNPPEDAAILSRNLGIWCIVFGTISLLVGGISILALIGGIAALVHWTGFRRSNARGRWNAARVRQSDRRLGSHHHRTGGAPYVPGTEIRVKRLIRTPSGCSIEAVKRAS